jgi:cytochrome P450
VLGRILVRSGAMVEYDPFSVEAMTDPHPIYRRLRDESPVHHLPQYDAWALSRFVECWQVLQDREHFSIVEGPVFHRDRLLHHLDGPPDTTLIRPTPSFSMLDPPVHTALRQAMFGAFTPRATRLRHAEIDDVVADQIALLGDRRNFDMVADLAGPVAATTTLAFLGLPTEDGPALGALVNTFARREPGRPGLTDAGVEAHRTLHMMLTSYVGDRARWDAQRESGGRPDVVAMLRRYDGGSLSDDEIATQLVTLLVGGVETLPKIVAGGLLRLWREARQRARLIDDPTLVPRAFEEIMRLEGVLQFVGRTLVRDVVVGGQPMRAGQRVLVLLQAANRDEREFADPDAFVVDRQIPRQLAFGHGVHFCIGAHPARAVGIALLAGVLRRWPGYQVDLAAGERPPSEFQIGWTRLPLLVG